MTLGLDVLLELTLKAVLLPELVYIKRETERRVGERELYLAGICFHQIRASFYGRPDSIILLNCSMNANVRTVWGL